MPDPSPTPTRAPAGPRVQLPRAVQLLRRATSLWPFLRGRQRIPSLLGSLLPRALRHGVVAAGPAGEVQFPYQPGDVAHPGFWHLYEHEVQSLLRRTLRPGDTYLDIGAHRGWHVSLAMGLVGPTGDVIACEPHPDHAASLRELARLNPHHKLKVVEAAVTAQSGRATLLATREEGWHTIIPEFLELGDVPRRPIDVATVSVDDLTPSLPPPTPGRRLVLKVDAEGAELEVVRGGTATLARPDLALLVAEVTGGTPDLAARAAQCVALLEEAGLGVSVLTTRGERPWRPGDRWSQVNVVARPAPRGRR